MNKRRCMDEAENSSFIRMCTCSSVNRNERQTISMLSVLKSRPDISTHINVSIEGTFCYLCLFFLEWWPFSYLSCYVSLGFAIRTVRTQNNLGGFEFSSFFQTCFPFILILGSTRKSYYNFFFYITTGKINVEKSKWLIHNSWCLLVKNINDLKFSQSFITRRSRTWLFIHFHLFFSLKSRSSFIDSSAPFKPVINGKLINNTKTHIELSQLVIVSQNFTSPKL